MNDGNVIDFQERLRQRAAAGVGIEDLQRMARKHYARCFRALAEQHGLSDAWATEKAALATEIVTLILQSTRTEYDFRFAIAGELDDAQQAAIVESIHKSAKELGVQIVEQCLDAFMRRALQLAIPEARPERT